MTQEALDNEFTSNGAGDVALCVERLIRKTNDDLKKFRVEQSELLAQISAVINENRQLTDELGKYKKVMYPDNTENIQERLRLTNDALSNARAQIEALQKERRSIQTLQECSQRTIKNMEMELKAYRTQLSSVGNEQSSQKYNKAIKLLEAKLTEQQEEMRTQASLIKVLHEHKQRSGDQIEQLQAKLKERNHEPAIRDESQAKTSSLQKQLREYEKSLLYTRSVLEESKKREAEAMRKVQEAIGISEAAVLEKVEAEKRAETFKEEANNLALNIGSIMDEAAKRVDSEVAHLKMKLAEKDKTINSLREKLKSEAMGYKTNIQTVESRNNRIALKYKEAIKQNEKLEGELESCRKRLLELERCAYNEEANRMKNKKNYETQMESYLHAYKELKAHYKELLNDVTKKFEGAFDNLHREKCDLQAENEILRNKAAGDYEENME